MKKIKRLLYDAVRRFDDLVYTHLGPLRVLFVVRNKFGLSCLMPMAVALEEKSSKIEIAVTVEFDGCLQFEISEQSKFFFDRYFIPNRKAVWKKWHFVITTDNTNLNFRRHHTMVTSSHGLGFGTSDRKQENNIDYHVKRGGAPNTHICFENSINSYRAFISQAPWLKDNPDKISFITGFAKSDKLFNSQGTKRESFLRSIGLTDKSKNIVIFSHWTEKSLLRNYGMNLINELIHLGDDFNIIINGHEKLWFDPAFGAYAPDGLREDIKSLEKAYNVRHVVSTDDMTGLLQCADLFITDYSGVFIECCLVDKPILLYKHPEFNFSSLKAGSLYCNASKLLLQNENVADLCRQTLSNPDEQKTERKEVVDYFLNRQGESASYVADLLLKMGRVCGPTSAGWDRARELSCTEMRKFESSPEFS